MVIEDTHIYILYMHTYMSHYPRVAKVTGEEGSLRSDLVHVSFL